MKYGTCFCHIKRKKLYSIFFNENRSWLYETFTPFIFLKFIYDPLPPLQGGAHIAREKLGKKQVLPKSRKTFF